jgi:hypothetical protein
VGRFLFLTPRARSRSRTLPPPSRTRPSGRTPPPVPRCGVVAGFLAAATAHPAASRTDTACPTPPRPCAPVACTPTADLAALWSVPQAPGRRDGHVVLRRLDGKGRRMLPLTLTHQTKTTAPAERAGAVLTVYLPGSTAEPAASRAVAPLPQEPKHPPLAAGR